MKCYVGIDNGVTGSIAILQENNLFFEIPIKKELSYTKKKQYISRLDTSGFTDILNSLNLDMIDSSNN
ncbi:MAG: hypothetical protein ACYS76_09690 [Planctomycetota bacterium]|jgi:hypothetical protein